MAIEVIGTIKPKNNGSFPIVEAKDVSVDENGTRLSEKLSNLGTPSVSTDFSVPTFDLAELGLVAVSLDGTQTILQTDTTEIISALEKGTVRFSLDVAVGEAVAPFSVIPNIACASADGAYMCTAVYELNGKILVTFIVQEGFVVVQASAFGETSDNEIPSFNLAALGLDAVTLDGTGTILQTDTTEIISALEKGTVRFSLDVALGEAVAPFSVIPNISCSSAEGAYMCTAVYELNGSKFLVTFAVQEGAVVVWASLFEESATESVATNIDLSKFDTSGQITETYADGSTKTTTIEFDADGNPVKITDGDGNVTTLTWGSLISFTVDGTSYQATSGMTWSEWVNSGYNTDGFWVDEQTSCVRPNGEDNSICTHTLPDRIEVKSDEEITASGSYTIVTC